MQLLSLASVAAIHLIVSGSSTHGLINDTHYSSAPHGLKMPRNYPKHSVFGLFSKTTHQLILMKQTRDSEGAPVVEVKACFDASFGSPKHPTPNGWVVATSGIEENPDYSATPNQQVRNRKSGQPNFVEGGDAQNPLGSFRLKLNSGYLEIHGNNHPQDVGVVPTNGCIMVGNAHRRDLKRLGVTKGTRFYIEPLHAPTRKVSFRRRASGASSLLLATRTIMR